jgi:trimeric autotransporter adhesin
MAVINGTSGNDTLADTPGDDTINGLGGNDTINGGSGGSDVVNGGDGRDSLQFMTATSAVIVDFVAGTAGNTTFTNIEKVVTGDFNDQLTGDSAAQNLTARAGMDTLAGGGGFDTLWGGAGADTFIFREFGSANADNIGDWTSSSDKLLLDASVMTALGTSGSFTAGDARFWASSAGTAHDADDRIIYETDTRQIWYDADGDGAGARQLIATLQSGATLVATDIVVEGGSSGGGQVINGTSGNDSLVGTAGDDTINGLGGNDTIAGGIGNDLMNGGTGNDSLRASEDDNDTLIGGDGNDTLDGVFHAFAEQDPGVDTLDGGLGDDLFRVDNAADVLSDTGGIDTVEVHNIGWTLRAGYENLHLNNDEAEFRVIGIGNTLDNVMSGSFQVQLEGLDGNDTLQGSAWSDTLNGGADRDTLTGGSGADTFVFDNDIDEDDTLTDFASGMDKLRLDGMTFTEIGASGNFAPNDARFSANSTGSAADTSDRIIYNTTSGQLWYDPDGTGAETAWLFAMLEGAPALAATDLEVINGSASGGTEGNDHLVGTAGDDSLEGLGGDDTLEGLAGNDLLEGGDGADRIVGGEGNDTLRGHDIDRLEDADPDTLDGGLGDDEYRVDFFDTILPDPGGIDIVRAVLTDWTLGPGLENLDLVDEVGTALDGTGNELDNVIRGATEGGTLRGMGGNDLLISRNVHDGGALEGGDGNDTLHGGEEGRVDGGAGNDILTGGGVFEFSVAPGAANADRLGDFTSGFDTIRLDGNAHANAGESGFFADEDARFAANSSGAAQDASDRVVYNTTSGELWCDVDGSGAGARQLIATLEGAPTLVATDIEIINGSAFGQVINGTPGNDSLTGTEGDDTINGLGGNDTLDGAGGADSLVGGTGDDVYIVDDEADNIVEGQNDGIDEVRSSAPSYTLPDFVNNLTLIGELAEQGRGNSIDNVIVGTQQSNTLLGREGNDTLIGGGVISGESGDEFFGGAGNDSMVGGDRLDSFYLLQDTTTSYGNDTIIGGEGEEDFIFATGPATTGLVVDLAAGTITGGHAGSSAVISGIEGVFGTGFADRLTGAGTNDTLSGGDGSDTLNGAAGNDRLDGGDGADTYILANAPGLLNADNIVTFATGVDELHLDASAMPALGASGDFVANDPRFHAAAGANAGHDADDRIIFDTSTDALWYDADGSGSVAAQLIATLQTGTLVASDIEIINGSTPGNVINGTSGNDTLADTTGNDTINGLGGNDTINGGSGGSDVVDGGTGRDSLMFMAATSAVVVSFGAGTVTGGGPGSTSFTNIEKVVTGDFNDQLTGDALAQNLTARSGADTLAGAGGVDTLWGGAGPDTFIFREHGLANADVVGDWTSGSDTVALEDGAFSMIGPDGDFVAGDARFWSSSTGVAHDANDRVIYNTSNGQLYYDPDGNASGAAQLIATFTGSPTVVATDISVI